MMLRAVVFAVLVSLAPAAALAEAEAQTPVEVMIVGNFHMANPGHDLHNVKVRDVLDSEVQAQIAQVTDALARFRPTKIAAEWPADVTHERYARYLDGTLPPSRNEVVQFGYRLAKTAGLSDVYGVDADGDFPYDGVEAWAKAHGESAILEAEGAKVEAMTRAVESEINDHGVAATLRYINDPARLAGDNGFYREMLRIGAGKEQPGADLATAWYRRNFMICANLIQLARPGDRIVVFYGYGHAFLLRQCVQETPGFRLVEPNDWLPK